MKQFYINDKKITAKKFGWDTCHKIYLVNTAKDKKELLELGYDLFPIKELKEIWDCSCSLRFINNGDLTGVVEQFENANFEYKELKKDN